MTILLAYKKHNNSEGVECGIISSLENKLQELEERFGKVKKSSQFNSLGFEGLNSSDLYVPLIYSPECLEGTYMERRFQREFEHFSEKDVSCLALVKNGLEIPQYGVHKPSTSEIINFDGREDLLEKVQKYVSNKVDGINNRRAA